MPPGNSFQYSAFISYCRKDSAFAEELQDYLVHYKLPRKLRKRFPHLPDNVRPIFRDKTGLAIDELDAALREALAVSKCLIVICSENAVRHQASGNRWVEKEVKYFLADKPAENKRRIIPVLYREEGGASATGCLLPVIRELGLLAADILDKGKERTFSDVVAKMLGVNPDVLWNDYEREQEAKRRNRRIAGGVLAVLAAAGAYGAWDYYCPHTSYYADYVECDNMPAGVNELTEKQIAARHSHYRITKQKHRVVRMSHCNSAGKPIRHTHDWELERPVTMVLAYNAQGKVARRTHEDEYGVAKMVWKFEDETLIDFDSLNSRKNISASSFMTIGSFSYSGEKNVSEITRFEVERDNEGKITCELFQYGKDVPGKDENGVWGRAYRYNARGQVVQVQYLGKEKNPQCSAKGVSGYMLEYDTAGEVVKMTYTGADGVSPETGGRKWAAVELVRDAATGNITEERYLDRNGAPCLHQDGYAKVARRYDTRGNCVEQSYFTVEKDTEKPCLSKLGIAKATWLYDGRGYPVQEAYFGLDGSPCLSKDGFAKVVSRYDSRGNCVEQSYQGTDSQPCLSKDGFAKVVSRYDSRGNCVEKSYQGTDNLPCLSKDGFAKVTAHYTEKKNERDEVAYFGVDGKPCLSKYGFAKVKLAYDSYGNCVEEAYLDAVGNACLQKNGFAKIICLYDKCGNRMKQTYRGTDNLPCRHPDGYAQMQWEYATDGAWVVEACLEMNGLPCMNKFGFSKVRLTYDKRGNLIESAYLDEAGKPCRHKNGFAVEKRKYDESGNLIEQSYHDVGGGFCLNSDDIAMVTFKYDTRGNCVEEAYFDAKPAPCACREGYQKVVYRYDARDNRIGEAYYKAENEACVSTEGYAQLTSVFDGHGNKVEQAYLDANGNPCLSKYGFAKVVCRYNPMGDPVEQTYYDAAGKRCACEDGYARVEYIYNDHWVLSKVRIYDIEGNLLQEDEVDS